METSTIKTVSLCGGSGHCAEVKVEENLVTIGEEGNYCVLSKSEWQVLRDKISSGEL